MILKKPLIFLSFLFFLLLSCGGSPEPPETETGDSAETDSATAEERGVNQSIPQWQQVYPGIEFLRIFDKEFPLALFAYRIDTQHPEREIIVSKLTPVEGFETLSKTVGTFAREYDTLVAINATTFEPYRNEEGLGVNLTTLSIYEGEIQANQVDPMAALLINYDGSVELHWPPFNYPNVRYAAGMGPLYLLNGVNRGREDRRHPRSGVGLSKDGRYLILMVIDGRDPEYSVGATLLEASDWMLKLGCWNAMNLDGGGSSTLVFKDPDSGEFITVNIPSGPPGRGIERPVANHIGVR